MTTFNSYSRKRLNESHIDLTPMLDVVFILLIFFVVTASFLKEKSLLINTHNTPEVELITPLDKNILIQVGADDRVYLNGEQIEMPSVRARVLQQRADNPEVSVTIKPNASSSARALVSVVNSSKEAGINVVSVIE